MKLYPKELHSVEALRREKLKLKYARKHSDNLVSIDKNTDDGLSSSAFTGTLMSLVSSKSVSSFLLTLTPTLLSFVSGKKKKRFISSVAREVLGGYIKFKAMQMAYRYIRMIVKKKKD